MQSTTTTTVLHQIRPRLSEAFGDRLHGVVLFGSEARADAAADSDFDLFVLLKGPVDLIKDIETIVRALYPLQLEYPERPIHALPVDAAEYEAGKIAVYRNAKREGVQI